MFFLYTILLASLGMVEAELSPPPLPLTDGHFFYSDMRTGNPNELQIPQTSEVRYVDILATDNNSSLVMTLNTM